MNETSIDLKKNPITEGIIWKEMLLYFFPILFGSLFQQIYNTADALIVGRYLGKIALSAVGGSSGQITMLIVGFFVGLASGASVLVAQYYGGKQHEQVSKAVHTVIVFSVVCGLVIMIAGFILTPAILRIMQTPEETMELSIIYLRVYFAGMVANLIYNTGSGVLRAVGDTRRPFLFLVVCCMLNVILDLLFILVFHMGVFGAAFATVLSQVVSAIWVLIVMFREQDSYQLVLSKMHMDPTVLRETISIGFPAGAQSMMYGISNIIIQVGVNGLGTDTVAAWATYYKIDVIFWMTVNAFGIAAATFVGQNIGANKPDRIRHSVWMALAQATIASLLICLVIYETCPWIFPIFTTDANVISIGVDMMRYLTRYYPLFVSIEILLGAMRGAGDTLVPMFINGIGVCLFRSIWIIAMMPGHNNIYTVMISYPVSWVITSLALYVHLFGFSKLKDYMRMKKADRLSQS